MLPQLRIRTEHSYRQAFGPVAEVADRLKMIECPAAGCVDTFGTWGHVQWQTELIKRGIEPMFGAEFVIERDGKKPRCWVLAKDLSAFYRLSSANPKTEDEMKQATGVIRFAGAALTDPEAFDYIDINPRSMSRTLAALELYKQTGKPLVITSDNDYPAPNDLNRFLVWTDNRKMTPQHILTDAELRQALVPIMGKALFDEACRNTESVAAQLHGQRLRKAPIIKLEGDLEKLANEGKQYRIDKGHLEWSDEYQKRFDRELALIKEKRFESYFLAVADLVNWAKKRMLVGPARGSAAGSLICYLLRITEVDPLKHGLIFERFIDVNREDLPDIDIDFNDKKREQVFEYLEKIYGRENVARIGSINRLKPRSVFAHGCKALGIPHGAHYPVLNALIEYRSGDARAGHSVEDTIKETQPGKEFLQRFPQAALLGEIEEHASHTGQHAAGIIVSNVPVVEYCTVRDGIAHVDKRDAEALNLLKIDVLGLRTLGIIEDAGGGEELYSLTFDDPDVLQLFNSGKFSGVFQFEGAAQRKIASEISIEGFEQIDHITALARPGPMSSGGVATYTRRFNGEPYELQLEDILGPTKGVVLYQEQVMRIVREVGGFSWEKTSEIRKAVSKSKGAEYLNRYREAFIEGAQNRGVENAGEIWDEIVTFGGYAMNRSHTVSYAMISYWCAYMKHHYPIEYAAACLRNAKDDEQTIEILRELDAEGVEFTPFDPDRSEVNWAAKDGRLIGGFQNLIGIGPVKARHFVNKREKQGLSEQDRQKIEKHKPRIFDLEPAHTLFGHIYKDPTNYDVDGPVVEIADLDDGHVEVVIAKLTSMQRRDENEAIRVHRRGKRLGGQTQFIDMFCVDDSVSKPVRFRVNAERWEEIGKKIADRAKTGDYFLFRGKWLERFEMMIVNKAKCLTNSDVFK